MLCLGYGSPLRDEQSWPQRRTNHRRYCGNRKGHAGKTTTSANHSRGKCSLIVAGPGSSVGNALDISKGSPRFETAHLCLATCCQLCEELGWLPCWPLWLGNPEETSSEVQNSGASSLKKRTSVRQKKKFTYF